MAALFHDVAEGFVGDPPASMLDEFPKLKKAYKTAEHVVLDGLGLGAVYSLLTAEEKVWLKMCDRLEGVLFSIEQRLMGNTQIDDVIHNGLELLLHEQLLTGELRDVLNMVRVNPYVFFEKLKKI